MTEDAARALDARGELVGIGPTGCGKTYALLSAAAWRAAMFRERTVISTESLSLQAQVLQKDAPVIVDAVKQLDGPELHVAVLKGVNNYVDPRKTLGIAHLIAATNDGSLPALANAVRATKITADLTAVLDGANPETLLPLVAWALEQYLDPEASGDRHSYDGPHTELEWAFVSASSGDAAGADDTALYPKALLAKESAAEADIVVTNHTMLAIQAALGVPIVIGNGNLGAFDHIIVDEAHALPDEVRSQGAAEVSGRAIYGLSRAVQRVADETGRTRKWVTDGEALADLLESHLRGQLSGQDTLRLGKDDDPLGHIGSTLERWAKEGSKFAAPAANSRDVTTMVKANRAIARAEELCQAIDAVSFHHSGEARWVQRPSPAPTESKFRTWCSAESSPVDVSGKIARNLWVRPSENDGEDPLPLGVVAVSATLPQGFAYQVGLSAQPREYESPFTAAYANSLLFIPAATSEEDVRRLSTERYGKRKFDTNAHRPWAAEMIAELVSANRGSALVLSASAEGGKEYARVLRTRADGFHVHSQWDGETPARLTAAWRDDVGSVLVGTRSLMTGVDAPGETCTLVILDRVPRRPSNPRDDARVEVLTEKLGDKWAADRLVYAADAALLEEQATGRLIRSMNDTGMVVVLDPRLLALPGNRRGPFTYPEQTRQIYMKPLYKFPTRTASKEDALAWLTGRNR